MILSVFIWFQFLNLNFLKIFPATAPIIIDEEESETDTVSDSQVAQMAMFQMRDPSMAVFRQQDLEELARQQQQWTMVAYQRSIMEKSYLQHQTYLQHQMQRDTERLRWEYAAQQQRELAQNAREFTAEDKEKLYRQVSQTQNVADASLLANPAQDVDQAKKNVRKVAAEESDVSKEKSSAAQFLHSTGDEPETILSDGDYEEGELRPATNDSHKCFLCNCKFVTLDLMVHHMEKHRKGFERSCSVCQSGTLTGNMLLLHMEASHGPESFLPNSSTQVSASGSLITSGASNISSTFVPATIVDFPLSLGGVQKTNFNSHLQEEVSGMKLPQNPQPQKLDSDKVNLESQEGPSNIGLKSECLDSFSFASASTSKASELEIDQENVHIAPDNFLSFSSQFYPLIGCQVCGEKFALSEGLDRHVESQHKDTMCTYSCKPCCLSFHTHVEYSRHMSRHESCSTNLKCSHCLKSFKSVKQLRLHYVAAHACCHFCEYCRAGFPDAVSLQLHEQLHTLDPEKLTFRCDICSKAFYTQSQCSAHKRTHKDEKAHACEVCGSAFFKRGDLTKHVRTVHSPSRLFACKFCGKKGTRMDNMRSHVRSHHKNMTRDQIINMIEIIE